MHRIAASNITLLENEMFCSPEFVCRYMWTGSKCVTSSSFLGATLGAAFLGAEALGEAVFFLMGMESPNVLDVSITGCFVSWFDTG